MEFLCHISTEHGLKKLWHVPSTHNHNILNIIRGTCQGGIRMLNYFEQTRRLAIPQQPDTMLCSYAIQDDNGCCRS